MQESTSGRIAYFPSIDGLRFLAFILVFLNHFRGSFSSNFFSRIGWTGVELFFLLSGFLLTKLLVEEYNKNNSIRISSYFIRRILRIWPLYFLYLLLIVAASFLLRGYPLSISRLMGNTFFYDNILTAISATYNKNLASIHLWSISSEEQYYLILPFLVPWLIRKARKKIIVILSLVFVCLFISRFILAFFHFQYTFAYVLPLSCDSFLAGILLGLGIIDTHLKKINAMLSFLIGAGLLIVLYLLPYNIVADNGLLEIARYFIPAAAFFFIFVAVVYDEQGVLYKLFSNRILRYLGKISFGLYIFHVLANIITYHLFYTIKESLDIRSFLFSLILTILLAILSYELIEKHFLKMKSRFAIIKSREV